MVSRACEAKSGRTYAVVDNKAGGAVSLWYAALYAYAYRGFLVYLLPEVEPYSRYVHLLIDLTVIWLGMRVIGAEKNRFIRNLLLLFLCSSLISYIVNSHSISIAMQMNGMRDPLVLFASYAFANAVIEGNSGSIFVKKFIRFSIIFLIFQIPAASLLFLRYGAGDRVGGSFGAGGGSGELTIVIFILGFYFVRNVWNEASGEAFSLRTNVKLLPFLLPCLLNETKISFVLVFLFFVFQMKVKAKGKMVIANIVVLVSMVGAIALYDSLVASRGTSDYVFRKEFLERYLYGEWKGEGYDMPRGTKIVYTIETIGESTSTLLFGLGSGLFKGGSVIERTAAADQYFWLFSGTQPYITYLLGGGGLSKTIIVLLLLFYPLIKKARTKRGEVKEDGLKKELAYFMIAVLGLIMVYNSALRNGCIVIIFATLTMLVHQERAEDVYGAEKKASGKLKGTMVGKEA
jgi:hypothetical protein